MPPVLSVRDADKSFGSTRALAGAELELAAGEWLALLGPNGAGKTTLVRAIAGRVALDRGRIELLGSELTASAGSAAAREKLGVVPQDVALYPLLTAGENLAAWGSLHGLRGADLESRVAWALEWTGLDERSGEPVRGFSGGMKRRLNIACGVLHRPEVVLLDEPTVGVDPQSRARIWEMLGELRERGASLLLTTHQLDEAQQVSDRIVIIDRGAAIAAGTFSELLDATVGSERRVTFTLAELPGEPLPPPFALRGDKQLECRVRDVAADLPGLLAELGRSGAHILDLEVEAPSLQAVFLHLTGRELRE